MIKMGLTEVLCELCHKPASWFKVEIPNPDRGWCKECNQEIGPKTQSFFFCSPDCMKDWAIAYHNSEQK